jgi:hypothetical protein
MDELMRASEERLSAAVHSGIPQEQLVAARITDSPRDFSRWEAYHAGLMRKIVLAGGAEAQRTELLSASLGLIHRKATFEYLRVRRLKESERVRFFEHFHAHEDYHGAVIAEHGHYLRSAASYLCSSHVGTHLMLDETFDEPLLQYERLYMEYFRAYCDFVIGSQRGQGGHLATLLMPLKREVCDWREALLALAHSRSGVWRTPEELTRKRRAKKDSR